MPAAPNHQCTFRPLTGGIAIVSAAVGEIGTLGVFATDGSDIFLVSCYHVLCNRDLSQPFTPGDPVFQPFAQPGVQPIAELVAGMDDPNLDCAAARLLLPPVAYEPRILGLGRISAVAAPTVGTRVLKAGSATGVTEGRIVNVIGDLVEIQCLTNASSRYNLSDIGDSGAVWVDADTGDGLVLHNRTQDGQIEAAFGFSLQQVLASLNLGLAP